MPPIFVRACIVKRNGPEISTNPLNAVGLKTRFELTEHCATDRDSRTCASYPVLPVLHFSCMSDSSIIDVTRSLSSLEQC
jgi:hypothetical protein